MIYNISIIEPVYKFLGYIFSITECRKFHGINLAFRKSLIILRRIQL